MHVLTNSDEIVETVDRGVTEYQNTVRPRLGDILRLPLWFVNLASPRPASSTLDAFHRSVDELIASRAHDSVDRPIDLLRTLLSAHDESGNSMSLEEVRHQVVTIFMAGHETTAQALTWVWFLVSEHPMVEARLHEELRNVLAGREPRHDDLSQLPYTRMVIEESMRLYPPAHTLAREAIRSDLILGHTVPAGSAVIISPWLLHRKATLWPEPAEFKPERFSAASSRTRQRLAYIPFGAGPRICIGAAFALEEAMLILATVAQRYALRLKPGHPVEPLGLITLRPRYGMKMLLGRRASPHSP
jgi:cytochrome P450